MKPMSIDDCPVSAALAIMRGKWKPLILCFLKERARRFSELQVLIPDASKKMLAAQLQELESDGVVERRDFNEKRPHVDYALSRYGETLKPALGALAKWGEGHKRRR